MDGRLAVPGVLLRLPARSRMDGTRLHCSRLEPGRSFRPEYFRHAPGGTALCRRFRRILVRCLRSLHLEDLVATVTNAPLVIAMPGNEANGAEDGLGERYPPERFLFGKARLAGRETTQEFDKPISALGQPRRALTPEARSFPVLRP